MSADTYIYITPEKNKKGFYEVWLCTASCVCRHKKHCLNCQKYTLLGKAKTLDEAIKIARGKDEDPIGYIEYGISFELWCK
jgi:hypothetical protein